MLLPEAAVGATYVEFVESNLVRLRVDGRPAFRLFHTTTATAHGGRLVRQPCRKCTTTIPTASHLRTLYSKVAGTLGYIVQAPIAHLSIASISYRAPTADIIRTPSRNIFLDKSVTERPQYRIHQTALSPTSPAFSHANVCATIRRNAT